MNAERSDFDRALRTWFEDGPTVMSDRVVDVIADRIARQPQRRGWRLQGRPFMNTYLKLAAGIAAVLIVAVIGYSLLPRQPGVGAPTVAPTPTATTPSPTVVAIRDVQGDEPSLDPGRWRFRPLEDHPGLSVVGDIPAGWLPLGQVGIENVSATNSPPSGLAIVFHTSEHGLFSDPCHWDVDGTGTLTEGDVEVGPTVADLVDALRANTSYSSTTPTPIAFGPYQGQQLELRFPADLDPATCDQPSDEPKGRYFVMPGAIYSQGPANIWRMSIVDVAGTRFIAITEHFPGTAPDKLAEAEAIVNSLEFTP